MLLRGLILYGPQLNLVSLPQDLPVLNTALRGH